MANLIKPAAHPFFPWVGGKRKMLRHLLPMVPERIGKYYEPFVGGGAVFFALSDRIGEAALRDTNPDLITAYQVLQQDLDGLCDAVARHQELHLRYVRDPYKGEATYYRWVQKQEPTDPVEIAARFIYLIHRTFRAKWIVDKDGRFNGNEDFWGKMYRKPFYQPENFRRASEALRHATVELGDFADIEPEPGSFVFCDPPYDASHDSYSTRRFGKDNQSRLEATARRWQAAGAQVIVTNADTPYIRKLYSRWHIHEIAYNNSLAKTRDAGNKKVGHLVMSHPEI